MQTQRVPADIFSTFFLQLGLRTTVVMGFGPGMPKKLAISDISRHFYRHALGFQASGHKMRLAIYDIF